MKLNKRLTKVAVVTIAAAFALAGCSKPATQDEAKKDGKLKVYTSFYPMYDFTKKIGGDKIDVVNLVPAGTEAHDWEPSTKDLADLDKADMLVYNGAGMESWVDKVVKSADNKKLTVVEASKGIDLIVRDHEHEHEDAHEHSHEDAHEHEHKDAHEHEDAHEHKDADHKDAEHKDAEHKDADHEHKDAHEHEHDHGKYDPHVWTSIKNARIELKNIKDALVKKDPANKDYYEENFKKYDKQFEELDNEYKTTLAKLPNKKIIVQHEAYGYLCRDYGLTQMGIQGLSPDQEPDPQRMQEIIKFAKDNHVKIIFFEDLVSPKVAKTIAKEVGAETKVLNPVEGLTQAQLDKGEDYISIMKQNLKELEAALK